MNVSPRTVIWKLPAKLRISSWTSRKEIQSDLFQFIKALLLKRKQILKVDSTECTFYSHSLKTEFPSIFSGSSNCLIRLVQIHDNYLSVEQL